MEQNVYFSIDQNFYFLKFWDNPNELKKIMVILLWLDCSNRINCFLQATLTICKNNLVYVHTNLQQTQKRYDFLLIPPWSHLFLK